MMNQFGEIEAAEDPADDRHDEVLHQRIDDLAERAADDHADGEIDHVALDREFAEFTHHRHVASSLGLGTSRETAPASDRLLAAFAGADAHDLVDRR